MATKGRPSTKKVESNIEKIEEKEITQNITSIIDKTIVEKKTIPLNYIIPVKSGVQGGLVYVSRKNGYELHWDKYGSIEYMEYSELVAMKNGHKRFFEDNWIFFEDTEDFTAEDIYRALLVDKYYKFIINLDNIDDVFSYSVDDIETKIPNMSTGLKQTIASRAKELIDEGNPILDSMTKIKAFEKALNCSFTSYE